MEKEKEKLKVLKENAEKAYQSADASGKKLLQDLFPGVLVPIKVTDRIKTFDDVLKDNGLTADEFTDMIENDTEDEAAYKRIKLIAKSLNEGELKNNQTWYLPVFNRDPGFGFSNADYDGWHTGTTVGSRLCFKSAELAMYAGRTFAAIYKPFVLTLNQ
ncbi:hypothetical protein J3L18_00155 [Mucilaginibacter gossypii]|uniref:hypothetical protein n=1 Tax=Mucilaginibacter gossypii TaxID=551996 RepID=UPI000DCEC0D1|nr:MULTISPECIES: hypothetical protein [Mucilaginibacter]QTE37515.1 hypothetical protein J3L18_00155 [Mucilaginibacter gossypii]RAV52341.1 hypothetical protein DIU36_24715 [Mucilaginibacter rubeus]